MREGVVLSGRVNGLPLPSRDIRSGHGLEGQEVQYVDGFECFFSDNAYDDVDDFWLNRI